MLGKVEGSTGMLSEGACNLVFYLKLGPLPAGRGVCYSFCLL